MSKWVLISGGVLGAVAVASGAFGAHALKTLLTERSQGWFDLAVTYQARHALALIMCGVLLHVAGPNGWLSAAAWSWLAGVLLFCGSLYLMTFTGWTKLGMITPIGGLLFIFGWLSFCVGAWRM